MFNGAFPKLYPVFFTILLFFLTCTEKESLPTFIQQASQTYKKSGDYRSLEMLAAYLHKGMPESEVKQLLGEPVYSPIEGQYYYASDSADVETHFVLGLVVNYTRQDSTNPGSPRLLKNFELMPIGE